MSAPAAKAASPAWARLRALEEDVRVAQRQVAELEAAHRQASGALDRARGPMVEYHGQVAAGEREADRALEGELLEAVRRAERSVTLRPRSDMHGQVVGFDPVDEITEARVQGAGRVVEKCRAIVEEFRLAAGDELAAELALLAEVVRADLQAAYDGLGDAHARYRAVRGRWGELFDGAQLREELPADVLREADLGRVTVPLPMPRSLTGEPPEPDPEPVPPGPSPGLWSGENG